VEPTDEELCRRVAERDEAAFDLLVGRYQERAWRLAWSILRDAEEARDVSQEAFVRLYQMAGSFAGRSKFSTWFYRVLVNLALEHKRRGWWQRVVTPAASDDEHAESLIDRLPAPGVDPVEEMDKEQAMKRMWAAVEGLSRRQRAAVLLYAQEELPTSEIAAVLRCSEATVRVHLHRALAALRRTMGKD
jgi:RNA polymerase sigma-70 factor (ECF subfamily)